MIAGDKSERKSGKEINNKLFRIRLFLLKIKIKENQLYIHIYIYTSDGEKTEKNEFLERTCTNSRPVYPHA